MRLSLFVPLLIAGIALNRTSPTWVFAVAVGLAVVVLTVIIERLDGPEFKAPVTGQLTVESLSTFAPAEAPLYLGGVGVGLLPATDWFTCRLDGRDVLVLESIPVPVQEAA